MLTQQVGGTLLTSGAERVPDPVERVGLAGAVAGNLLPEPAAAVVDGDGGEFDDVDALRTARASASWSSMAFCSLENGFRLALLTPSAEDLSAGAEPLAVGLPGPARDQVQQRRPWPPVGIRGQVDHAGQVLDPRLPWTFGRSLTWCHMCSST